MRALFGAQLTVALARGPKEALASARATAPQLVLVDLRLGDDDGLELVRTFCEAGLRALICVHSNDSSAELKQAARRAGAHRVLPKPLKPAQLRSLVDEAMQRLLAEGLPQVGVVDDSRAVQTGWKLALRGQACVHGFPSPEALLQADERDGVLSGLDILITDQRFEHSPTDGLELARAVRQKYPALVIAVSSSGLLGERDIAGVADVLLDKATRSWPELARIIAAARGSVAGAAHV
jgi:CheY-like chemotaxis protein